MDSTKEHLEQQQNRTSGIAGDLRRLKSEGGATAAEVREFLSHLKGRSPQEVMGVVAESTLFRSILTATAGCFVLLVVLTVVPYAINSRSTSVSEKPEPAATTQSPSGQQAASAETTAAASEQAAATAAEPDLERAAKAMGIGGTTEADPNSNPLDSKLDKLLDGIE